MIRLAVAAPSRERCGIADHARFLADALPEVFQVEWIELPVGAPSSRWREAASAADGADLVHVHYEYGLFAPVKPYRNRFSCFMRRLRPPAVVSLHGALPELTPRWKDERPYRLADLVRDLAYLPFFSGWTMKQYSLASQWIVHSEPLAGDVARFVGEARVACFPMPVPASRHRWSLEEATGGLLVTPGFIKAHKGYERLLDVLAHRPQWRWTIAGGPQNEDDEIYLASLKEAIRERRLEDRVEITGYLSRSEMEETLARATLAVLPFRHAAGSASMAWAMAVGMPLAASDLPSMCSAKQGGAGIELLPSADAKRWPEILGALLAAPARLRSLAKANAAYAERNSFASMAGEIAQLFRALLASHSGRRA